MSMRSLRRLVSRQASLNKKLRKAVVGGKPRVVAEMLELGASPTWMEEAVESSEEMNALLLACYYGDVEILDLLLDSFFSAPQMLNLWGRPMYCVVIRNGHWKAFRRLYDRKVPLNPVGSVRSKLPAPMFIAAETGQSQILQFLVKTNPVDAAGYSFSGHSLLSIASKNGHYECVEVLLAISMVSDDVLDFAIDVARHNTQSHVLVLLLACLPQYNSRNEPIVISRRPSVPIDEKAYFSQPLSGSDARSSLSKPRRSSLSHNRGSLAETEILSDDGDERDSLQRRRGSTWLNQGDHDLHVYHPYLDSDDDEMAYDEAAARRYEAYIQGIEAASESGSDWTSTPPIPSNAVTRSLRSLSIESEEKTEETLARIADRRETTKKTKRPEKQRTWFYHNEVILPYDEHDDLEKVTETTEAKDIATPSLPPTSSVQPPSLPPKSIKPPPSGLAPRSAKPPLPPPTAKNPIKSFRMPTNITQVSRKVISVRSKNLQTHRASI